MKDNFPVQLLFDIDIPNTISKVNIQGPASSIQEPSLFIPIFPKSSDEQEWWNFFDERRGVQRTEYLKTDHCFTIWKKQNGLCAITNIPLTRVRGLGRYTKTLTNASPDRIKPNDPYVWWNIQIVCVGINLFRGNLPMEDFKKLFNVDYYVENILKHKNKDLIQPLHWRIQNRLAKYEM